MRRNDIANYLSVSHETISRQLTILSKEKVITIKQRTVNIIDLNLLKSIVEPCLTDSHTHSDQKFSVINKLG